jgi:hypothetical protein
MREESFRSVGNRKIRPLNRNAMPPTSNATPNVSIAMPQKRSILAWLHDVSSQANRRLADEYDAAQERGKLPSLEQS